MADAKFTPGPWSFHPFGNPEVRPCEANGPAYRFADMCIGQGDKIIATVEMRRGAEPGGYPTVECEHEMEANASLIAAAPELYAALDEAVKCSDMLAEREGWERVPEAEEMLTKMRAALAKARGEQ